MIESKLLSNRKAAMVYQKPLKQRMGLHDKKPTNFNDDSNWVGMKVRKYVHV